MTNHIEQSYIEQLFGKEATKSKHKPIYIDRSDLEASADCPHSGRLRKKHEGEIETTDPLPVTGEIVHKIAEEAIKFTDGNLQEAADYFAEELPKALGRTDLQPEVIRAGKNLANELARFSANRILLCEQQIARTILPETHSTGEIILTTRPDLVLATTKADTILVLDYKSGHKKRTNQEARDAFQTCHICWCLKGKFPDIKTIHFWYLETRTSTRAYAKIVFDQIVGANNLAQEMAFEQRLLNATMHFVNGDDDAWPSQGKCGQCPVVQFCKLANAEIKKLDKNPSTYLDQFIAKQTLCDEMIKAMKAYVKNGRVIYGSTERFAFEPKPKYLPKLFVNKEE